MRAAIIFLLAMLSAVAKPAAAEWTFFGETGSGDQYFVDLSTLKKGARPRAWFMTNYSAGTEEGVLSDKILREADCSEEKIRLCSVWIFLCLIAPSRRSNYHFLDLNLSNLLRCN